MRWPFTTRSDTFTRAPGAPGTDADRAAFAARETALTRFWGATRPAEPGPAAWDAVWARVSDRLDLDRPEQMAPEPLTIPWRRYAVTSFAVAQAAALLAVAVLWEADRRPAGAPGPGSTPSAPLMTVAVAHSEYDIEPGGLVLIHLGGQDLRAEKIPRDERPYALDEMLVTFNEVEAMAGTHPDAHPAPPPG